MSLAASTGAWHRADDKTYGYGKFPWGVCQRDGCAEAACHLDGRGKVVCSDHLPKGCYFSPYLGQQTKLWVAKARRVLGGGGAGGSKTYMGSRLWMKQALPERDRVLRGEIESSMGRSLFLRRTVPELDQQIEKFKKYIDLVDPGNKWNSQKLTCTLSWGYVVRFGGMEDDDAYLKYYGDEYTLIVFDEATQFLKKQIQELDGRLRCPDPVLGAQLQLYLLTNPVGGDTKTWLRKQYVKKAAPETVLRAPIDLADGRTVVETQVYIPCNLFDNPGLIRDGRYEANLRMKSAAYRRMLLENDWDVDEGSWVGEDWDPSVHICRPFKIPAHWPRFKCGDYGYSSLATCHWYAVDPEGNLVCYRALSCRKLTAKEWGERIREIEKVPLIVKVKATGERITVVGPEWDEATDCSTVMGPLDSSCWSKTGENDNGESRGEILENLGVGFYPAAKGTNMRHNAADQFRRRLRSRTPDAHGSLEPGVPGIRYMRGTTDNRIVDEDGATVITGPTHTLPVLPFDPNDPDVPDTKANDHDWDADAYGLMSRPVGAPKEEAEVLDFMSFRARGGNNSGGAAPISW